MKFYGRKEELTALENKYNQLEQHSSVMTVITGRRRVGKTVLAEKYARDKKHLYFFISKKSEKLLCEEFASIIKQNLSIPIIGELSRFSQIFNLLLEYSKSQKLVLIIDEFQEFHSINPSVYSEIQHLWDSYKETSKMHVIFIGSVYSLMVKIFQGSHEPLFGRADHILTLRPFTLRTLKNILIEYNHYTPEILFGFFLFSGGIPRYIDIFIKNDVYSPREIMNFYCSVESPFLEEGKTILVEEFGKEYGTYFSILEMLSRGRTSRSEIESILEKDIGGYLERLVSVFNIVTKVRPVGSKITSRNQKYKITDNFLKFWFRFIYKNRTYVEQRSYNLLLEEIEKSYSTYSGPILESFFLQLFAEEKRYHLIGTYWERGNTNEIDLFAVDNNRKVVTIGEVKLNKNKINLSVLKEKSVNILQKYKGYKVEYLALSFEDIDGLLESKE